MREVFFIYSIVVCTTFNGVTYDKKYIVQTNAGSSEYDEYEAMPNLAKRFMDDHLCNIRDLGYIGELGRVHIVERWSVI